MKLARVAATVISTINVPVYDNRTLLLCDLLSPDGTPDGGYLIAVDTVGAGAGETVLLMDEGNSARQILAAPDAPVRTLIVGIVDHVELDSPGSRASPGAPAPARRTTKGPAARRPRRSTRAGRPQER